MPWWQADEEPNDFLPLVLDKIAVRLRPIIRRPPVVLIDPQGRQQHRCVKLRRRPIFVCQDRRIGGEQADEPLGVLALFREDLLLFAILLPNVETLAKSSCQRDAPAVDRERRPREFAAREDIRRQVNFMPETLDDALHDGRFAGAVRALHRREHLAEMQEARPPSAGAAWQVPKDSSLMLIAADPCLHAFLVDEELPDKQPESVLSSRPARSR